MLRGEQWWGDVVKCPGGVDPDNTRLVAQPVLANTRATGGANLVTGWTHLLHDSTTTPVPAFALGRDVAATPGRLVLRNDLIELIQHTPVSATLHATLVLIIPAWIRKTISSSSPPAPH